MSTSGQDIPEGENEETRLRSILAAEPENAPASTALGVLLGRQGRFRDSAEVLSEACRRHPGIAELRLNLGIGLQRLGLPAQALAALDEALRITPDYPEALLNKGGLFQAAGDIDAALDAYNRAIDLRPNYPEALMNRAFCFLIRGRPAEALADASQAIEAAPNAVDALNIRGMALQSTGDFAGALADYDRAIAIAPSVRLYGNRANCLDRVGHFDDALSDALAAAQLAPNSPECHRNIGACLCRLGRFDEALAEYRKALEIAPGDIDLQYRFGLAELLLGHFKQGWRFSESRLDLPQFNAAFQRNKRWDGKIKPQSTLVIRAEQGYGDTIQFVRLLGPLKRLGQRVIFECQPGLGPLLAGVEGADEIVEWSPENRFPEEIPQISLLSLPFYLGIDHGRIPFGIPYLSVDAEKSARWAARLEGVRGVRVGICWAGRPTHENDRFRSATFADFEALASVPNVTLVSLQMGDARQHLTDAVIDPGGEIEDFTDTAAIVENLDLVITVDTSVAHLAGALGKPVWNLISAFPDWRWQLGRDDSPWYPTMRLFRQEKLLDWGPVFEAVQAELAKFATSPIAWQIADVERRHVAGTPLPQPISPPGTGEQDRAGMRLGARAGLVEICRQHPNHAGAFNSLGVICWADGDVEMAVDALTRAVRLDSGDPAIVANCADVMLALGRADVAQKLCTDFLSLHGNHADISAILARTELPIAA